jgi:hypothetical protein
MNRPDIAARYNRTYLAKIFLKFFEISDIAITIRYDYRIRILSYQFPIVGRDTHW